MENYVAELNASSVKTMGNAIFGYISIPVDMERRYFMDVDKEYITYANDNIKLSVNLMDFNEFGSVTKATDTVKARFEASAVGFQEIHVELKGVEARCLHTYYQKEELHLYVYVINTGKDIVYMSIEYSGGLDIIRELMEKSYRIS